MCHPPDWAMCLLLVFFHVVTDRAVQRLGTLEEKDVTVCIGSRTPEGWSTYRPLILEDTRSRSHSGLEDRHSGRK
jgi:hypothetical protein